MADTAPSTVSADEGSYSWGDFIDTVVKTGLPYVLDGGRRSSAPDPAPETTPPVYYQPPNEMVPGVSNATVMVVAVVLVVGLVVAIK